MSFLGSGLSKNALPVQRGSKKRRRGSLRQAPPRNTLGDGYPHTRFVQPLMTLPTRTRTPDPTQHISDINPYPQSCLPAQGSPPNRWSPARSGSYAYHAGEPPSKLRVPHQQPPWPPQDGHQTSMPGDQPCSPSTPQSRFQVAPHACRRCPDP